MGLNSPCYMGEGYTRYGYSQEPSRPERDFRVVVTAILEHLERGKSEVIFLFH